MIARRLISAWGGRRLWMRLRRRHDVDSGVYVVAFIEDDQALNDVGLRHVADLVADRRARGAVVVTDQRSLAAAADEADGVIAVEHLTGSEIDRLLSYYELYEFSPRICFVSLTRPVDNRLSQMVGVNDLTLDDLICLAIYRIRGWSELETSRG